MEEYAMSSKKDPVKAKLDAGTVPAAVGGAVTAVTERIGDLRDEIGKTAHKVEQRVEKTAHRTSKKTRKSMRRNPTRWGAAAAGLVAAGAAVVTLLTRRRRSR
jgi:hypothetical protein